MPHFNYEACVQPEGTVFRIHAEDDEHAKAQMEVYMKEMNQEKIQINKLELIAGSNGEVEIKNDIEVFTLKRSELARSHQIEYRIDVHLTRYVNYKADKLTKSDFEQRARQHAECVRSDWANQLRRAADKGQVTDTRCEPTPFTDDDLYGACDVDVISFNDGGQ